MEKAYHAISDEYLYVVDKSKKKLRALIAEKNCALIMVCHAWHGTGTFDVKSKIGGPFSTIWNPEALGHGANAGLVIAVNLLEPIKEQFSILSYADFYQLASVVAVEVTGDAEIPFYPGRQNKTESPKEGRSPDVTKGSSHLWDVFGHMGLGDKEIVALFGAHILGRCHKDRSSFEGAWTENPLRSDNSYFKELVASEREGLLQLPSDKALVEDPKFCPFVELYAQDEDAFFCDYVESHMQLSDLVVSAEHEAKEEDDALFASSYGLYHMRIKLPDNLDANGIKAELKDGVLKIRVSKLEGAKQKHQVQIEQDCL
ncbi:hypothetical protein L7F22_063745 [Adiantum nelumboides]|nr:hypothetical protein [Adiantum nelumboides]